MVIDLGTTKPDLQGNTQGLLAVRNVHELSLIDKVQELIKDWTPVAFDKTQEPWKVASAKHNGVTVSLTKRASGGVSYVAMGPTVERVIEVCAGFPMFPADKAAEIVKVPAAVEPAAEAPKAEATEPAAEPA